MSSLDPEQLVNPRQNQKEAIWLPHMLLARNEFCFLDWSMLQRQVIVVNREDLIFCAIDKKQACTVSAIQCTVLQKRELVRAFLLECLDIIAVAPLVCQSIRKAENRQSWLQQSQC